MNKENIKSQMRKGILEYCILLLISKEPMYAPEIVNILKESHILVVEGTIYPLLTRLKTSGFLEYKWEEASLGHPRKYYYMTEKGKEFLEELKNAWDNLNFAVENIKNKTQNNK